MTDFRELACDVLVKVNCTFGEKVSYYPSQGGGPIEIQATFDDFFEQVDPDTEVVIASNQPTLLIKLTDIPFLPIKGDVVRIKANAFKMQTKAISYTVYDSQEDGQGGSELFMHKVSE